MKIKLQLFLVASLLSAGFNNTYSQINVGPTEEVKMKPKTIDQVDVDALIKTKTAFIYGKSEVGELENWKKVIAQVWTITPVEFISYEKFASYYAKTNYSFITISGFNTSVTNVSTGFAYDNSHFYLNLWMKHINDKGKAEKKSFFRIELYPDFKTYAKVQTAKKEEVFNAIYGTGKFFNLYPGLIMNDLKLANDCLKSGEVRWLFQNQTNAEAMGKLSDDTLYMPDYMLVQFNAMTGDETKKMDEQKLMAAYTNIYKYISAKELSDKIVNGSDSKFYYLIYVKSSTDKYLNVFNSQNGELIYSRYKPISYNVSETDFKDLMKAISGED